MTCTDGIFGTRNVAGLSTGPGDHVEAVESAFYERITLIDGGEYGGRLLPPVRRRDRAGLVLGPLDWVKRRTDGRRTDHRRPGRDSPCCGTALTLPELRFEAPVGLARFEVSAMNWARSVWEFSEEKLTTAGDILGHPVTQIHTRY